MAASERQRDHAERQTPAAPDDAAHDSGLDEARAAGELFLSAGDEAIRRALSGDSEAFLRANRQRGGE